MLEQERIFLAENKARLYGCFTEEQINDSLVLDYQELKSKGQSFEHVKYLFSTWGMPSMTKEEIRYYFPSLQAVFYAAGTVHYFADPFLDLGIRVFSGWAANAVPVAEFAAAQIILANKGYFQLHRRYRLEGHREAAHYGQSFLGNYKVSVGILGAGMIGRHVIKLLSPYQIEVWVYDPYLTEEQADSLGVIKKELKDIFQCCQTISNHMPNLPETVGILDGELFSLMKPNGVFINTGRGAQVRMADLLQAMAAEPGRTALLDVTDPQEPMELDAPVWELPNVFLSPHRAGAYTGEIFRIGAYMWEEYQHFITGLPTQYEITREKLKSMA